MIFTDLYTSALSVPVKAASSLTLSLVAFPHRDAKAVCKNTAGVMITSITFSGLMALIYQLFRPPNFFVIHDYLYFEFNPLIMIGITLIIYLILTVFHLLFREKIKRSVVPLTFVVNERSYHCTAKVDTGCNIREPFSDSPIIIVDQSVYTIEDTAAKRVIPYSTIDRSSILYATKADSVCVDGRSVTQTIYIAQGTVRNPAYQAIINSDIVR